jgi:hypothetical protein
VVPEQNRSYLADFNTKKVIFETKGRLTSDDRKKMLLVKEQNPEYTIVMVFSQPGNKIRKGSKTTYIDWCEKNGLLWMDYKKIVENPKCILSGIKNWESGKLPESPKKKSK